MSDEPPLDDRNTAPDESPDSGWKTICFSVPTAFVSTIVATLAISIAAVKGTATALTALWKITEKYAFVRAAWVAVAVLLIFEYARRRGFDFAVGQPAIFVLTVGVLLFFTWDAVMRIQQLPARFRQITTGMYAILAFVTVTSFVGSFLFGIPLDWQPHTEAQFTTFTPKTVNLDATRVDGPPKWIYPTGQARDDMANLRNKMGKWIPWAADGAAAENTTAKLIQASWTAGFPGRHKFSVAMRFGDYDRTKYVVLDGIVFAVDLSRSQENMVTLRQFPLNVDEQNPEKVDPICELKEVRQNESLFLLLLLVPKDGAQLPSKFDIWLERT